MVHFNTKYGTITNAIDKKDGIAVVAVLFEVFSNSFRLSRNQSHFEKTPYTYCSLRRGRV